MHQYGHYETSFPHQRPYRTYLIHHGKILLLILFALGTGVQAQVTNSDDQDSYPKASPDATKVYRLQSNWERTRFFIDGKDMGIGRKLTVMINNKGHTIVARPENCQIAKEEFIQPPYSSDAPLGFTFHPDECHPPPQVAKKDDTNKPTSQTIIIKDNKGPVIFDTKGNVENVGNTQNPVLQEKQQEPKKLSPQHSRVTTRDPISPKIMEVIVAMQALCLASSDLTIEAEGGGGSLILRKGANIEGRYRETEIPTLLKKLQNEVGLMKEASEIRKCMEGPRQRILDYLLPLE